MEFLPDVFTVADLAVRYMVAPVDIWAISTQSAIAQIVKTAKISPLLAWRFDCFRPIANAINSFKSF